MKKGDIFKVNNGKKERAGILEGKTKSSKLVKLAIVSSLVLALTTSFMFTGCGDKEAGTQSEKPPVSTPVGPEKPVTPVGPENPATPNTPTTPTQPEVDMDAPTTQTGAEVFDANGLQDVVVKLAEGNFSHKAIETGGTHYLFSNVDKIQQIKNADATNEIVSYTVVENGQTYAIEKLDDGQWHKNVKEENENVGSLAELANVSAWTYDSENKNYTHSSGLKLEINDAVIKISGNNEKEYFYDIGATKNIELPENVIDDTVKKEYVYEVNENGEYTWNMPLLKEVLLDWHFNNQFGDDISTVKSKTGKTKDIIYINPSETSFFFTKLMEYDDGTVLFCETAIDYDDFFSQIQSGEAKTPEGFKAALMSIDKPKRYSNQRTPIEIDYDSNTTNAIEKEEWKTITENVFRKLKEDGLESEKGVQTGEKFDFDSSKVFYGFKTQTDIGTAGYELGNVDNWRQIYLIEYEGQLKYIEIAVHGSRSSGKTAYGIETVKRYMKDWFLINRIDNEVIVNNANADLYKQEQKTKSVVATAQTQSMIFQDENNNTYELYFNKEKNKEL